MKINEIFGIGDETNPRAPGDVRYKQVDPNDPAIQAMRAQIKAERDAERAAAGPPKRMDPGTYALYNPASVSDAEKPLSALQKKEPVPNPNPGVPRPATLSSVPPTAGDPNTWKSSAETTPTPAAPATPTNPAAPATPELDRVKQLAGVPATATTSNKGWAPGVLGMGSRGPEVKALQKKLGITDDGIFGPDTKKAVQALQQKLGVTADGAYGPITKKAEGGAPAPAAPATQQAAPTQSTPTAPAPQQAAPAPAAPASTQPTQSTPTAPATTQPVDNRPQAPKFKITKDTYAPLQGQEIPPHYTVTDIERGVHVFMGNSDKEAMDYVRKNDPEGAAQTQIRPRATNESLDRILTVAGLK